MNKTGAEAEWRTAGWCRGRVADRLFGPNRLKPGSVPARHAVQCRAKQPARPAAEARAADGMRLPRVGFSSTTLRSF